MNKCFLRIADIIIGIKSAYRIDSYLKKSKHYSPFIETHHDSTDGEINILDRLLHVEPVGEAIYEDKTSQDTVSMYETDCGFLFRRVRNQYVIMEYCMNIGGWNVNVYISPELPKDEIFALVDVVISVAFRFLCIYHQALPIHSSAIVCNNRAIMSLGVSGRGKSTHSSMWMEAFSDVFLLNDDLPIIRFVDGSVYAYGSPWSGKKPCYRNECYKVGALLQINRGHENKLIKAGCLRKNAIIRPCIPTIGRYLPINELINETLAHIINSVDVYDLYCTPDVSAAQYVRPQIIK